jgi:biopolymer transport protein ExbD
MAGVSVGTGGARGRRALDSDINMVPMIDLLMVTIAFLLVTAVWSQLGRLQGSAQVPSSEIGPDHPEAARVLHVDMRPADHYVLSWRQGATVATSVEVPRDARALRDAVEHQWRTSGSHTSPQDPGRDEAVLHVADAAPFSDMVAVMDAIEATRRPVAHAAGPGPVTGGAGQAPRDPTWTTPAFALTLATQ